MRQQVLDSLKKMEERGYETHAFDTAEEMRDFILKDVGSGKTVGFGGSMTVSGLEIPAALREQGNTTYFHWEVAPEERPELFKKAHTADIYMMSANAVTEDGIMLNIDGVGNRVAALICGPKTVYIITGENKFVKDNEAALERVRTEACPPNARRLNQKTPCATLGKCTDCRSADRMCRNTVWTEFVPRNRRYVICVADEKLGY